MNLQGKTKFLVMDFLHTSFEDNSFDVVFGVESICHAKDKADFLKEAYRILKPGGRIVVIDGFLRRNPNGPAEERVYSEFLKGLALDNLAHIDLFKQDAERVGFKDVETLDKTKNVMRSSEEMYELMKRWQWLHSLLSMVHLVPQLLVDNLRAGIVQRDFIFNGPGMYAIVSAQKPL